ncbi:MAG TPA: carbohydrate kinase family protein [Candidatus Acidoferrales bacterium]|nr:carbohydrate kinase family protein [Candidatus Acidoferrales bacterium]
MPQHDLTVFGEIAIDVILAGVDQVPKRWSVLGKVKAARIITAGTAGYVAQCFAKLGGHVAVAGKIGSDGIGKLLLQDFRRIGISTKDVQVQTGASTEISTVIVYLNGNKSSMVTKILPLELNEFNIHNLTLGRALHFAGYLFYPNLWRKQASALFKAAKREEELVSVDPQMSATGQWSTPFREILKHLDLLLLDEEEARRVSRQHIVPQAVKRLIKDGVGIVAVKTGAKGCVVGHGDEILTVRGYKTKPVSTIGAGDAFDAAFIFGLLQKWNLKKTAQFANVVGAISTTEYGCMNAIASANSMKRISEEYYHNS